MSYTGHTAAMKTAISLPDDVFNQAERLSRRKHMSRSELYTTAIKWFIAKESGATITKQLDQVYGHQVDHDRVAEHTALVDLEKEIW